MTRALLPFSWVYGSVVAARNRAYDRGLLKGRSVGVPVICVGNLSAGGTGKTPLVEYIVRTLLGKGRRVAVVSRGYRRRSRGVVVVSDGRMLRADAKDGGDEPVQIAMKFPSAPVVVGEKRADAAEVAVRDCAAGVIVLDDGFQHRGLNRDLDILVIDARRDITREPMLPAGTRRESVGSLRRAGLVAISNVDKSVPSDAVKAKLGRWYHGPFVKFRTRTVDICRASDRTVVNMEEVAGKTAFAFSGIADHSAFLGSLRSLGCMIAGDHRFPDHHWYDGAEIAHLIREYRAVSAQILVTTEKDAVRLWAELDVAERFLSEHPVFYTRLGVDVLEGGEELLASLDRCCDRESA